MDHIAISRINASSPIFTQLSDLREEVLRKPLGRSLKDDDLTRDDVDEFFIALHQGKVIGCVALHALGDGVAQLRAMAVYNEWQGKGVGSLLVASFEKYAWETGFNKIILHARKVALGFYKGLGYDVTSGEFTEVGIPHYIMEKQNQP